MGTIFCDLGYILLVILVIYYFNKKETKNIDKYGIKKNYYFESYNIAIGRMKVFIMLLGRKLR